MKRLLACLVLLPLVASCSDRGKGTRTLTLALETSPNRLDPAFVVDVAEGLVCSMLYQGLVRFDPDGRVVPDLALGWEIDQSGTRYTFHLDPSARFSDGRRVGAKDVAYSFERVLSPTRTSPRSWVLSRILGAGDYSSGRSPAIEGIVISDDSTIVIQLEEPFAPFIMLLGMPAASVVPAGAGDLSSSPLGSGPWRLERWERGDRLLLVPNEFCGGRRPGVEAVELRIVPEPFTRIAEFESGNLDILQIPSSEIGRFLSDNKYSGNILQVTELRVVYIGLNNRKAYFRDRRVRRAMNMAVNVDRIIQVLLAGQAERSSGSIPPGLPGHKRRGPYPYDPAGAMELLEEAGLREGFRFELWSRDSPEGNLICEALQGYMKEIGVDVKLVKREWSAFKEAVSSGKVDAFFLDWFADYPDAENFIFPLFHSSNVGGGGNRAFFENRTVDSLIEKAQSMLDEAARVRLYARIDSLVYEEAPWIYLYHPKKFYAVSEDIKGYSPAKIYLGEDLTSVRKLSDR